MTLSAQACSTRVNGSVSDFVKVVEDGVLHYWESEDTRPKHFRGASDEGQLALNELSKDGLQACLAHPFKPLRDIRREQFERIKQLVHLAYNDIAVYGNKYRAIGFTPDQLKSWSDFERLPIITKDELIAAFPDACVNPRWEIDSLFSTRSFGTSGKTLPIKVNMGAILTDTLQGARQFWLQSGMKLNASHLTTMIYTVPWWFESIGGEFKSAFISGIIHPEKVAQILNELKPHVISCYPTTLKGLIPYWREWDKRNLFLVVVHSEGSTRAERELWSRELGVPVLDEYSSEEATRMALELPCGHYHVCEDAVYMEVLDPKSHEPQQDGVPGLAVVTNLLNEAMPFIRYFQGDYVSRPSTPAPCLVGWSQLASIDGRVNDSFVNLEGRVIPAGVILDVLYRWMFDSGLYLNDFQMIQRAPDAVEVIATTSDTTKRSRVYESLGHLGDLLHSCVDHPVEVAVTLLDVFPPQIGKRRVIRKGF